MATASPPPAPSPGATRAIMSATPSRTTKPADVFIPTKMRTKAAREALGESLEVLLRLADNDPLTVLLSIAESLSRRFPALYPSTRNLVKSLYHRTAAEVLVQNQRAKFDGVESGYRPGVYEPKVVTPAPRAASADPDGAQSLPYDSRPPSALSQKSPYNQGPISADALAHAPPQAEARPSSAAVGEEAGSLSAEGEGRGRERPASSPPARPLAGRGGGAGGPHEENMPPDARAAAQGQHVMKQRTANSAGPYHQRAKHHSPSPGRSLSARPSMLSNSSGMNSQRGAEGHATSRSGLDSARSGHSTSRTLDTARSALATPSRLSSGRSAAESDRGPGIRYSSSYDYGSVALAIQHAREVEAMLNGIPLGASPAEASIDEQEVAEGPPVAVWGMRSATPDAQAAAGMDPSLPDRPQSVPLVNREPDTPVTPSRSSRTLPAAGEESGRPESGRPGMVPKERVYKPKPAEVKQWATQKRNQQLQQQRSHNRKIQKDRAFLDELRERQAPWHKRKHGSKMGVAPSPVVPPSPDLRSEQSLASNHSAASVGWAT